MGVKAQGSSKSLRGSAPLGLSVFVFVAMLSGCTENSGVPVDGAGKHSIDATPLRDAMDPSVPDGSGIIDAAPPHDAIVSNLADSGPTGDAAVPADAGIPQEGEPCSPDTFDSKCADPRFLGRCSWSDQATGYVVENYDCWFANHPSWNTFETCQSDIQEAGQLVDKCQCEAGMYICFPNVCPGGCAPAAISDQCIVYSNSPGDTTTRLSYIESCSTPESCASDWRGQASAAPISCMDYGSQSTPDAGVGLPDACTPETDFQFCTRLGKNCGGVEDFDNCGATRTVGCGNCVAPESCGGSGTSNVCGVLLCDGSYIINNVADLMALTQCTAIGGDLTVSDWDLSSLGLPALTSIGGDLILMTNSTMANLNGLSNLASVGGTLRIDGYDALTNLDGLSALVNVGSIYVFSNDVLTNLSGLGQISNIVDIAIGYNDALLNLDGLNQISSVGYLTVTNNGILNNLSGLDGVSSIGFDLKITNNDALVNIGALGSLGYVGRDLLVTGNDVIAGLTGFSGLGTVGRDVHIRDNGGLISLAELSNLSSIGRILVVHNNAALENLSLDGLTSLQDAGLSVKDNSSLPTCRAEALRDQLLAAGWSGPAAISGNDNTGVCN